VAQDYLLKGPKSVAKKIWSKEDDKNILSRDPQRLKQMQEKRGKPAVEARLIFIAECS